MTGELMMMGAKGQILVSLKYWTFLLPTPSSPPKSILVCKNLRFFIQFKVKNQKLLELVELLTY